MNLTIRPRPGVPTFSANQRAMIKKWLKKNQGKNCSVSFSAKQPKRSDAQNRYYWGVYLPILSEDLGYTTQELHAFFKGKFLTSEIKKVMGQPTRVTKSTADLNKSDFCEYILNIEALTEIPAPDTSEYGLAPLKANQPDNER